MIPMVDLKRQYLSLKDEIDAAIQGVLEETKFILGPNVSALEEEIASYHGVNHAVGVANGTDALMLALRACGIRAGDEVITTPFTFIATAEVIALLNATPVFVDISPQTFNIDAGQIEEKITSKTKAIMPVHLFGQPADMQPILEIARQYGLKVIEDCAQAFGAKYRGQKVGTFGDVGCFSFFPSKNLAGYGDGGMIITRDEEIAQKVRMLRNHGSFRRYYHEEIGHNSRLDEIQAAIIRVKLKKIDQFNAMRQANAETYRRAIKNPGVILPWVADGCEHVYHQFTVKTKNRDDVARELQKHEIACAVYYPLPLHRQEVFRAVHVALRLPQSESCAAEVLSLPMFPELSSDEIHAVADILNRAAQ